MPYQDILSGFNARAAEEREVTRKQQAVREEREYSLLDALAKSPDPQIASMAVAGMLNFADPRVKRKGLAGFIGETEGHPALQTIQTLLRNPVIGGSAEPGLPGQAAGNGGQLRTPPAQAGSAAQPATSPAQGGPIALPMPLGVHSVQPPPATTTGQVAAMAPPAQTGLSTPPPDYKPKGGPTVRMRRAFSTGPYEDRARSLFTAAEEAGSPLTPEQKQQVILELSGFSGGGSHGAAGQSYAEGNIVPDPDSPTGFSQTLYLRADPTQQQKIPAPRPTDKSSRSVNTDETVAYELFGPKYPGVDPRALMTTISPAEAAQVTALRRQRESEQRYQNTSAAGQARAEQGLTKAQLEQRQDELFQRSATLRTEWQKVSTPAKELNKQLFIMEQGLAAAKRGDRSAGDQAVLVTFQKMLDPLSVVREAEYFRSATGLSLIQRAQGAYERLVQGGASVPLQELESYAVLAKQIASAVNADATTQRDRIAGTAGRWGVNNLDVFGADAPEAATPPPGPPAPGGGASTPGGPPAQAAGPAGPGGPPVAQATIPGPPQDYRRTPAHKIGDQVAEGKIVAIHPQTGDLWLDVDGPIPPDWQAAIAAGKVKK